MMTKPNWFWAADEHYGHTKVIEYCDRPFTTVEEMDACMISNHNSIVTPQDVTVHCGDFSLFSKKYEIILKKYIKKLNGTHIFIDGSHDWWLKGRHAPHIWEKTIEKQPIVCCHYAMRTWPRSHYGSWHLFGHSHGMTEPYGKSFDVGVDSHNFKPWSFDEIKEKMKMIDNEFDR
jgi:calcineurin-like phosphoesterase family protein